MTTEHTARPAGRQFSEMVTSSTKGLGKRNLAGRNNEGSLQGAQRYAGLVEGNANIALLPALDFTQSPFLFLCLLLKVFSTAEFFSSSQRAVSVISKGRSVLAGPGAFLIKQTP